jgi:hypothetical protein
MRNYFIAIGLILTFAFFGTVFAQQDPNPNTNTNVNDNTNPFNGGQVHDTNNPQTNPDVYTQDPDTVHDSGSNVNDEANVNNSVNPNENYNTYEQGNAYSEEQNLAVENYVNDKYNPLTDPNVNQDIYLNQNYNLNENYNFADTYNPFVGLGFNRYDPWEQKIFQNTYQSWFGIYHDPQGTDYKANLNDTFDRTNSSQLKQFKFNTNNLFSVGASTNNQSTTCTRALKTFADLIYYFVCIVNTFIIQLLLTLALLYFAWGVGQYVLSSNSVEERQKARQVIIYGLVAMFVIVSVWGIVALFKAALGL